MRWIRSIEKHKVTIAMKLQLLRTKGLCNYPKILGLGAVGLRGMFRVNLKWFGEFLVHVNTRTPPHPRGLGFRV